MAKITKHAKKRLKERTNLQSKAEMQKNLHRALKFGIRHNEAEGILKKWMDKIYLKYKIADDIRIYNGFIYIFNHGNMITMYPVPQNINENLEQCVDAGTYSRYIKLNVISAKHKQRKQQTRLKEKQTQFREKVLLDDIMEYIMQYNLNIQPTGVHLSEKVYTIRYIPQDKNTPVPTCLADYIKDISGKQVILKHIKDRNGNFVYQHPVKTNDIENKLIYSTIFDEYKIN